ncbi:hypothetical protein NDN08_002996 [Rhodosorus marinus]|uniref:Myb-like domain-containing protein n=1 Tax=Rhodosorus marinus TaxID=101924 RepID=A0AAV8UZC4_9RHOD|nr:hypothetical protein NDN08_002996 [Rhodosorus marinus]
MDVAVNEDMLDTIVVEQQNRISLLEEEIKKAKKKIAKLRAENAKGRMQGKQPVKETISKGAEKKQPRYWTAEEHRRYLISSAKHGEKNYGPIAKDVGTRSAKQVRTHHQKYLKRLERESTKLGSPTITDIASPAITDIGASPVLSSKPSSVPSLELSVVEDNSRFSDMVDTPEIVEPLKSIGKTPSVLNLLAEMGAGTVFGASLDTENTPENTNSLDGTNLVCASSLASSEEDLEFRDFSEVEVETDFFADGVLNPALATAVE